MINSKHYPPELRDAIERYEIAKKRYRSNYPEDSEELFPIMMMESARRKGMMLRSAHRALTVLLFICLGLCFYILYKGW